MKSVVQDAFLLGTGIPKLGFGGFYSPTIMDDFSGPPLDDKGLEVESFNKESMVPWVAKVAPKNFVGPAGLVDFRNGRWVAECISRPLSDVQRDPRFDNTKELKTYDLDTEKIASGNIVRPLKMVKLWEIRDKYTGEVFVLAPDHGGNNKILFKGPDAFLRQYGGFNYFPLVFIVDDEAFWGLPDSKILEPYQMEVNEIKTQIMRHRRACLVKILIKEKGMTEDEADKLVSEDVAAVAFVRGQGDIGNIVQSVNTTIPRELFVSADTLMQDVRETVGFSRNQVGEFNSRSGDTTATEANIVRMASEIRVDERRDSTADVVVEIVEMMHGILFDNWGPEQIVDVIGPGGVQVWIRVRGDMIKKGRFLVKIDPDSSIPETRQLRENRAIQLYQFLSTNPLIDPIKLTQYLLHEMRGPQFDDMMKMLPGVGGFDRPVEMSDFTNMISRSVAQAQQQQLPAPQRQPAPQPQPGEG